MQSPDSGHADVSLTDSELSLTTAGDPRISSLECFASDAARPGSGQCGCSDGSRRKVRFNRELPTHSNAGAEICSDDDDVSSSKDATMIRAIGEVDFASTSLSSLSSSSPSFKDYDYADYLSPLLFAASRERGRAYSAKKLRQYDAKLFCRDLSTVYSSQSQACFNYFLSTKNGNVR